VGRGRYLRFFVRPCRVPSSYSACWRKQSRLALEVFAATVELKGREIAEADEPALVVVEGNLFHQEQCKVSRKDREFVRLWLPAR
jgi:hypothetical protein